MTLLLLGIIIFFGIHLLPSFVGFRLKLIETLGEIKYKGLYSVLSLTGIILIVYGKSVALFQPVWEPLAWSRNALIVTMTFSFILFAMADIKSNIKRFIRHPMLLGVALWSGAHLFANGDLGSILLFGAFCLFSVLGIFSANLRGAKKQQKIYPIRNDVLAVMVGLIAYAIFIKYLHPYLIGVPII